MEPFIAIFKRDVKLALSYKLDFILRVFSAFFSVVLWYYLSLFLKPKTSTLETPDYFTYVIVGMMLLGYINVMLFTFSQKIRNEQVMGTLEMVVSSPSPFSMLLLSSALWEFLFETFYLICYIVFALLLGAEFNVGSYLALIILFFLTMVSFGSLGIMASSFLIVFKKGEPITPFISAFFALLGNVFFPTNVLPPFLKTLSQFIPLPYAASGLRKIIIEGGGFYEATYEIIALFFFCIILFPLSILSLEFSINISKKYGLLGGY